jgi:hypothetical protein
VDATPQNCVTLYKDETVDGYGEIWNNGITLEGSLTMRTNAIYSHEPIKEKDGILLPELKTSLYSGSDKKIDSYSDFNNKELVEMKKSIANLSKNVSELNKWKSKLSGRIGLFRRIFKIK